MGYVTLSEAKAWLGITDTSKDTLITGLITAVSEAIDGWTGTRFDGVQTVTGELHDARRQDVLVPLGYPVIAVTGVTLGVLGDGSGGVALSALDFTYDEVEVKILARNLPQGRAYAKLAYTWGYTTCPERVKLATNLAVEGFLKLRGRVGVTSKSKEGESISYKTGWDKEAGLPIECVAILSAFRRIDFDFGSGTAMATRNV